MTIAAFGVLLMTAVAFRPAPATTAVSGSITLSYTAAPVAKGMNANGLSVFVSNASGTNQNTGETKYLAGARVTNVDTAAMVNGNGTHSGLVTFTEGTSKVVKRFSGTTTTKMAGDKPESTIKGSWTIMSGTGKYAGITGSGTYAGRFETSTRYKVEWKGTTSM
jgi:hypothetical protein